MTSKLLTVDDILKEVDSESEPSIAPSFTLEDLLNQQEMLDDDGQDEDFDDMFENSDVEIEEVSDTKPSKRSDTVKSVSVFQVLKPQQVPAEVLRTTRIRNSQLKEEILNKNMTYVPLQTVSAAFDTNIKAARGVAVPNCIYSTSSKFLAIGTTLSNIALFEVGVKDFRILKEETKVQGKPTSLCISEDNKWLVGGFEAGSIILWDLATSAVIKIIASVAPESPSVIKVQFWKGNSEFLSLDSSGNVVLHTIEKYLWTGVRSRKLFQTTAAIYHDARTTTLENGHIVVAFANIDYVYLIRLEPSMEIITKLIRPSTTKPNDIPTIQFGKGRTYELTTDILLVSWGLQLTTYKYNGLNRGDKLFELDRQFSWNQPICSLQMLAINMLLVVDSQNTFTVINISQDLEKGAIKNQTTLEHDLYYRRALRDGNNQPLKLYSSSVCKCTQQFKEVFLLTKNSVVRGRLHRWTEFIRYLIQERQWDQILKASIEIFYGRLDIFAERVVISPTTVMLFNELTVVYVKSRLDELQDRKGSIVELQVQEILDTVIEFCLELKLYRHLFQTIFELVGGFGLTEEYFESLGNFISLGRIPQVPSKFVFNALIEYFVKRKVELVDRLVASLRPESLDYASTIEVCHKHKLFYSQMYVSQLNGDFITPLNEILAECRKLSDQGYSNDKLQANLQLTYSFVLGVLEGKTITGVQLNQQLHQIGLKKIVVWYLIRQNADFLIGEDAEKYFEVLTIMMTNQTVCELSDSITLTISLAEYTCESLSALLDSTGKQSYRQLFGEALVKISGVWQLQSDWVMYVIRHLKPNIDEEWLTKFINKNISKILEADTEKLYQQALPKGVLADILIRREHYTEAIQAYQDLNDVKSTQRLFQRLPEECLITYLPELVKMNPKFAGDALYMRLSSEGIDESISQLPNSIFKYELLRRLHKLDGINDIRWREANSLFYLQSLCQYRSENRVYEQLRRRDFNILEALKIVRGSNYKLCEAYMQEVNCQPLEAFHLYCYVFQQQLKSDFAKILRFKLVSGRQLKKIFSSAVHMLNSLPFDDGHHYLQLFDVVFKPLAGKGIKKPKLTVLQEMDEVFKKKGKIHEHFAQIFTYVVCETLQLVASAITTEQMKLLVDGNLQLFSGQLMQERLRSALSEEQRKLVIVEAAEKIAVMDTNVAFRRTMDQKTKAISGTSECALCQKRIYMSDAYLYPCGCSMHEECLARSKRNSVESGSGGLKVPGLPIILGTEECPCCKLRQQPSTRELRLRLRPVLDTPKKDLRKSSASLNERNFYFSYLSFDESKKLEEDDRFQYLLI